VSLYVIGQLDQQHSLLVFTTVSLVACLAGVGCWAILGQVLTKFLATPSKQRTFNRVMAITLLASVSMIWF
jgi:threonine/homoserine/homoserine lactone efflux protein